MRRAPGLLLLLASLSPAGALAVPGPESVCVVANSAVAESVALALRYAEARGVPDRQVCPLELPDLPDITLEELEQLVLGPLESCLEAAGALERVEAVLLVRGVPLRVSIPTAGGDRRVSLAAALAVSRSRLADGTALLGQPPGNDATCGTSPCYAARWRNPFAEGPFEAGWSRSVGAVDHHLLLVTMLHGRSYEDAALLVDSALRAEAAGGARGEFLLMEGADPARGALDLEYGAVVRGLEQRGYSEVSVVPFDAGLEGRSLAAFFTGSASLGAVIEGNEYLPGSLADNLTSFGALPENFAPEGESQVSIARWVGMGVAGVHGTTDEPLNNVFPSRRLVLDYVDGSTLAESFHRNLPYLYWHNLVLGDPMAAPYAVRPEVTIGGVAEGDRIADARTITVGASHPGGGELAWLALLVDGAEVARVDGPGPIEHCLSVSAGRTRVQLLAVAQAADDGSPEGVHVPKGWASLRVEGAEGTARCEGPESEPDGDADANGGEAADADPPADADGRQDGAAGRQGCSCRVAGRGLGGGEAAGPLGLLVRLAREGRAGFGRGRTERREERGRASRSRRGHERPSQGGSS